MSQISNVSKYFNSAIYWSLFATLLLVPVAFNPLTSNIFELNKLTVLTIGSSIALIAWLIKNMITKSFRISLTPFTAPLFLFALANLASSYAPLDQMILAFVQSNAQILFLAIFFITGSTVLRSRAHVNGLYQALTASGLLLSIAAILEIIGVGPSALLNAAFGQAGAINTFITPAGSAVALTAFLIPTLIVSILLGVVKKNTMLKGFFLGSSAVMTAALVISVFNVMPGRPNAPVFMPFDISWQVAAENIKQPKKFLLGVGPQNYVAAFTLNKPAQFNATELWNTRFGVARNQPLQIFTTTGLIGFAIWTWLIASLVNVAKRFNQISNNSRVALVGIGLVLLIHLVVPANSVTMSLLIGLMTILAVDLKSNKDKSVSELVLKLFAARLVASNQSDKKSSDNAQLFPYIIGLPIIVAVAYMSFNGYKIYAADIQFRNSLVAATANDGGKTYETQRQALILNPYNDQYHRAYANTNLQLATSISQSENPSDQDRNNITQLIQQAIREGRAAITVQPNNPANWEALANIYRQLIGVAQDAPQWTTATYAQAINIDPNNPRLRLELGGVYFQLQDFATAQRFFEQAVTLKPNYANAHYNLARAYVEQDQIEAAVNQYNAVLSLIDRSSADYQRAMDEQDLLKKQLGRTTTPEGEAAAAPETKLSVPQPIATPTPGEEQIDLGEDVAPPENVQGSLGQDGGDFPVATPEPEAETDTEN